MFRTIIALCLSLAVAAGARAQNTQLVTFGAGDVTGGYYAAATAICEMLNRSENGLIRCSPDPTSGSIYNLNGIRTGELDFALVQSDWHRRAYLGTGQYSDDGPMRELRSVMGLYGETLTLVARRDSGIRSLGQIRGKRIDIGQPTSGRRATVDQVLDVFGYVPSDFSYVAELPVSAAIEAVCQNEIDATVLVVGHPNAGVNRLLTQCDAVLVPLGTQDTASILAALPDMKVAIIQRETYPGMAAPLSSVAVTATVVTRADMDPAIVASLVRNTLGNLGLLGRKAPVLNGLDPVQMRTVGLTAPLHPGAEEEFDQAGHR